MSSVTPQMFTFIPATARQPERDELGPEVAAHDDLVVIPGPAWPEYSMPRSYWSQKK